MKYLVKVTLPSEATKAIRDGSILEKMQRIFNDMKPEAAYFVTENGRRTQYIVVNADDAKPLPYLAEPWWLMFNADVDILPAFTLQDMESIGPILENVVKKFG
jgi:hypothetical protein